MSPFIECSSLSADRTEARRSRLRGSCRHGPTISGFPRTMGEVVVEHGIQDSGPRTVERALDEPEHKAAAAETPEARKHGFQESRRVQLGRREQAVSDAEDVTDRRKGKS